MELQKLIQVLDAPKIYGDTSVEIKNIQSDSRQVEAGSLFVAVCGTTVDGHAYIPNALEKGAVAIVCEKVPGNVETLGCPVIAVKEFSRGIGTFALTMV